MEKLDMRKLLLFSICVLWNITLRAQLNDATTYIEQYKHIAISEMHRSGIPASITIAQGIFESGYGQSQSALEYKNHFGIKCKKEWLGNYYFKPDDDYDKHGNLIPSCFRAYDSVEDSFLDHTNFLIERERYQTLFEFHHTDYTNWAEGLQKCGYATNKQYAKRLVNLIEKYELWKLDHNEMPVYFASQESGAFHKSLESTVAVRDKIVQVSKIDSLSKIALLVDPSDIIKTSNRINRAIILPDGYARGENKSNVSSDLR